MFKLHAYQEHCSEEIEVTSSLAHKTIRFLASDQGQESYCVKFTRVSIKQMRVEASYYIGLDWIDENNAIYIVPKLNENGKQTDYLGMLFSCLEHPYILRHTDGLYQIKFDQPFIEIEQKQDLLTPLLILQFLQVVRGIVRKGLKKSYYPVVENLHARVKGKVLVGQTIKQNVLKNRVLTTMCRYEEFGWNGLENRLLKKALLFIHRYLTSIPGLSIDVSEAMNYCLPAFENVSDQVALREIKYTKTNAFYKEYDEGLRLARLILKRFGYNIQTISPNQKVKVPPFWIDMSKLFELYVLGLLKARFGESVKYHFKRRWNELDYLLVDPDYRMVVDAKYKTRYQDHYLIEDIRQVSGYARIEEVVKALGTAPDKVVDCLIIYPDQGREVTGVLPKDLRAERISGFVRFFKCGVRLPVL